MRAKGPSQERQLQIARERGLELKTKKGKELVVRPPAILPPAPVYIHKAAEVAVDPLPTAPCFDCIKAGLGSDRHKVEGGWCIDGVFWPHSAIGTIRHVKLLAGDEAAVTFSKALTILTKEFDLDLDKLKASYVR